MIFWGDLQCSISVAVGVEQIGCQTDCQHLCYWFYGWVVSQVKNFALIVKASKVTSLELTRYSNT